MNIDAAKLPAGLLVAAALVHFAPQWATGPGLLALAVGAFVASALKLKGLSALVGLVVVAVVFGVVTGLSSPGLQGLGDQLPTQLPSFDQLAGGGS